MKFAKSILSLVLIFSLLVSGDAYAGCDFAKDIKENPNKTFEYTEACHQKVGQIVQDDNTKTQQVKDLTKALSLKDLALQDSDKSKTNWMNTSAALETRLQKVDGLESKNDILYFGAGFVAAFLAAIAAAKLAGK
jgi:hypothetical protein